ncbi:MAG: pro-sigmaK processing inhibitor BofA family protein [Firmicutes bacterium]|nr:pro-sigmaK processing inhibitor BofA family protein [Bacillota bacterium]
MDFCLNENNFMIWICVAAVLILFFIRQVKFILKKVFSVGFGFGLIYLINAFLINFCHVQKFCIGINFLTAGMILFLNWWGIFLLYLIKILF